MAVAMAKGTANGKCLDKLYGDHVSLCVQDNNSSKTRTSLTSPGGPGGVSTAATTTGPTARIYERFQRRPASESDAYQPLLKQEEEELSTEEEGGTSSGGGGSGENTVSDISVFN